MQIDAINSCKQFTSYEDIKKTKTINYKNSVFNEVKYMYTFTDTI